MLQGEDSVVDSGVCNPYVKRVDSVHSRVAMSGANINRKKGA